MSTLRWLAAAGLAGCATEPHPPLPVVHALAAMVPADNVLSARVSARVEFADSLIVRYGSPGASLDSAAPAAAVIGEDVALALLGLLPEAEYELRAIAYGDGGTTLSEPLRFRTEPLPEDLPRFRAGGPSPSPGYVLFASGLYGLIIDNTGRVVWYVRFATGPSLNFQGQPNGRYLARPATPDPNDAEPLVEFDPLGEVTRTLGCARGLRPRFHDVLVEPGGGYWLMCDETRIMDLTAFGGVAGAAVTGTVVQRLDPAGALAFEWSPFDHFEITDVDEASRAGPSVNWTHGNAIDLDTDGNLLVSFRSLNEVTKIDTRSGAVLWRLGGLRNQFDLDPALPPFRGQHGVRVAAAGELVLLDNLGEAGGSRAERYAVDGTRHTGRLTRSYTPSTATLAELGGTTQILADGRVLVSFGDGGAVQEYDASGAVVWQIEGDPGFVFRAQRIRSLYHPGLGLAR